MKNKIIMLVVIIVLSLTVSGCSDNEEADATLKNSTTTIEEATDNATTIHDDKNTTVQSDENNTSIMNTDSILRTSSSSSGSSRSSRTDTNQDDEDITSKEDVSSGNCPTGTTWTMQNPATGELVVMEITDTEEIDGVELCHAVYESNTPAEDGMVRMEYYWSAGDEADYIWTSYDINGNIISEIRTI